MCTDFNHFHCYDKKCMTYKSKITPATSVTLYSRSTLLGYVIILISLVQDVGYN